MLNEKLNLKYLKQFFSPKSLTVIDIPANIALSGQCWLDTVSNICQPRPNAAANVGAMRLCTKVQRSANIGILLRADIGTCVGPT